MSTRFLPRPDGRIAYEVREPDAGSAVGATVLTVPGMGDLRTSYRHLVPQLLAAGHRVVTADLRGHGDSDTTFGSYGDAETADDVVALLELLGPAVVAGSSMGAGSAVIAAARRPDLVSGLVLLGPFVRDPAVSAAARLALRVAMAPPWAARAWQAYLPTLYAGRRPDDHDAYVGDVVAAVRRPGYARAFSRTTRTSHALAEQLAPQVQAPSLVVMGERDPDFDPPAEEAAWVAEQLRGQVLMVPDAGHYPHSQRPDLVAPAVLAHLAAIDQADAR
jgi:pimeloyl-ACP methyl ester carboxylesterase